MRRAARMTIVALVALVASAHVGSPNVFFNGDAGPYKIRVIVRPPMVVPGLADVVVRVSGSDVNTVTVRPVFLRVGVGGSPSGDVAEPVRGEASTYSARLWLMRSGAYSVYVTIDGARGTGSAIVPVMSVATGRLGLTSGLTSILAVLGLVLVAGLVTIIRAAAGESLVPSGHSPSASVRRRANVATILALPFVALALLGGARWWQVVDRDYQRTMFRPPGLAMAVNSVGARTVLTMSTRDTASNLIRLSQLIPDHGKMMHLFLVNESTGSLAHLHPVRTGDDMFTATLPSLPAGSYRAFADVTTEQGSTVTLAGAAQVPAVPAPSVASDADDGWTSRRQARTIAGGAVDTVAPDLFMRWAGNSGSLTTGHDTDLRFTVHDARGAVVALQPYLGMAGHAVITADDGSVFIHLHPMGTISPAVQRLFALRDGGDTTATGRLRVEDKAAITPMTVMRDMPVRGELSFPYEFPKAGRYHVWVQVKHGGRVLTGVFAADVR